MSMERGAKIYVAGHKGLAGSAIWRELERQGFRNLIGKTHSDLDLVDTPSVQAFLEKERPDYVFVAAAKVGGILANDTLPADFLYLNLQIQSNLIHGSYRFGVKKLLFLSSSCVYPKHAPQPTPEAALLTGLPEATNQWYSVAKIAGMKLCQAYRRQYGCNFISAVPNNLYGPNDNYDPRSSHVLPALIRRFHDAKTNRERTVTCWGSGAPLREFLFADDLGRACTFLMETYNQEETINVGSGKEVSIRELSETVAQVVGFDGEICWDTSKPDGAPRKLLDTSRLHGMGFRVEVNLREGIRRAYEDYLKRAL